MISRLIAQMKADKGRFLGGLISFRDTGAQHSTRSRTSISDRAFYVWRPAVENSG